jgi:hypothetical protein
MNERTFRMKMTLLGLDAATFGRLTGIGQARINAWREGKKRVPCLIELLIDSWCRIERLEAKNKRRARR